MQGQDQLERYITENGLCLLSTYICYMTFCIVNVLCVGDVEVFMRVDGQRARGKS